MKNLHKISGALALLTFAGPAYAQTGGTINFDGKSRTYKINVPSSYSSASPSALVIVLHGTYGNGTQVQTQTGFTAKSNSSNFIAVYPEGISSAGVRSWNAGECCYYAAANNIDDVGFIDTLIDVLENKYKIDTNRIYATGMSNGGFMSYRLACELSHRIAAIAPVASSMSTFTGCNPVRPLPVMHVHAYDDPAVPYQGGTVANQNPPATVIALNTVFNTWAVKNNCSTLNKVLHNDSKYTHTVWSNCSCNADIESYFTSNGAHSWPGGGGTGLDTPSQYINATDSIWNFFLKHPKNCNTTTNVNEPAQNDFSFTVYPQPANDYINLAVHETARNGEYKIEIFNSLGQHVKTENIAINENNHSKIMDVNNISSGIYFLRISNSREMKSLKMIIR